MVLMDTKSMKTFISASKSCLSLIKYYRMNLEHHSDNLSQYHWRSLKNEQWWLGTFRLILIWVRSDSIKKRPQRCDPNLCKQVAVSLKRWLSIKWLFFIWMIFKFFVHCQLFRQFLALFRDFNLSKLALDLCNLLKIQNAF